MTSPHTAAVARRVALTIAAAALGIAAIAGLSGCAEKKVLMAEPKAVLETNDNAVVVAVAPPVADTGLADRLSSGFAQQYPEYKVRLVGMDPSAQLAAVSGGQADALIVPRSAAFASFQKGGFVAGTPKVLMSDSYLLIGPKDDPANAKAAGTIGQALARIAVLGKNLSTPGKTPVAFCAPTGGSAAAATAAWQTSGVNPAGKPWYFKVKGGMGQAAREAAKRGEYAIVDHATWALLKPDLTNLAVIRDKGVAPTDVYVVAAAAGARSPRAAQAFVDWVSGPAGAGLIGSMGVASDGTALFSAEQ